MKEPFVSGEAAAALIRWYQATGLIEAPKPPKPKKSSGPVKAKTTNWKRK